MSHGIAQSYLFSLEVFLSMFLLGAPIQQCSQSDREPTNCADQHVLLHCSQSCSFFAFI